jgi:hypothetical protein
MSQRHNWTTAEEEIVQREVNMGKKPKEISKILPHITMHSIQLKVAKLRSKRPKFDAEIALERKPSRGKFFFNNMIINILYI